MTICFNGEHLEVLFCAQPNPFIHRHSAGGFSLTENTCEFLSPHWPALRLPAQCQAPLGARGGVTAGDGGDSPRPSAILVISTKQPLMQEASTAAFDFYPTYLPVRMKSESRHQLFQFPEMHHGISIVDAGIRLHIHQRFQCADSRQAGDFEGALELCDVRHV